MWKETIKKTFIFYLTCCRYSLSSPLSKNLVYFALWQHILQCLSVGCLVAFIVDKSVSLAAYIIVTSTWRKRGLSNPRHYQCSSIFLRLPIYWWGASIYVWELHLPSDSITLTNMPTNLIIFSAQLTKWRKLNTCIFETFDILINYVFRHSMQEGGVNEDD